MKSLILFFLIFFSAITSYSQITQFRGPDRDGSYPDTNLKTTWPDGGPALLFRIDGVGVGHSSPVVYNNIIYVTGKNDSIDLLSAVDANGKLIWQKPYGKSWSRTYSDTRHTPTIENNRIYISSGMGEVVCMDAKDGSVLWIKNPHEEFKGVFGRWGMAESLLITEEAVIASVGGEDASVVALDKKNGELLWKSPPTGDQRAYVSPLLIERNGQEIILVILSDNILGINAENGEIFWKFNLIEGLVGKSGRNSRNNTNTPLYKNGEIFITSGYDASAVMLSLSKDGRSVELKWKNDVLDTHHGGVVEVNGYIYGSNWESNNNGKWVCLEWETGKVMYETEWINKGQIIYADGHLYCKEERTGMVALVPASTEGFHVNSSFQVDKKPAPYWSHPAIDNGRLLIRQGDTLFVYDIQKK